MRLSEAIRLGAMLGPQGFGKYQSGEATCAFGAAYVAVGLPEKKADLMWPWVNTKKVKCPACGLRDVACFVIAEDLNDIHRWTRERIADWVATVEPEDKPQCELTEEQAHEIARI